MRLPWDAFSAVRGKLNYGYTVCAQWNINMLFQEIKWKSIYHIQCDHGKSFLEALMGGMGKNLRVLYKAGVIRGDVSTHNISHSLFSRFTKLF